MTHGHLVHVASRHALGWALLAWIVVTATRLAAGDGGNGELAETGYRMATGTGFMALTWFGVLNIYYGVIRDFSISQIVVTAAALGFGGFGSHVAFSVLPAQPFVLAVAIVVAVEFLVGGWLFRQARLKARHAAARPVIEPTLRGSGAVLDAGPDGVRLVPRNGTGRNTPAERFEQRLIRHIERILEVEAISMAGTNSSYWRFRLPAPSYVVELSVVGPGYNTSARLRDGERWLLRVREPKPGVFTQWIGRHFTPEAPGVTRNLGVEKQTQFASSLLTDDNQFFATPVPWPDAEPCRHDGPVLVHVLMMPSRGDAPDSEALDGDTATATGKPTIH